MGWSEPDKPLLGGGLSVQSGDIGLVGTGSVKKHSWYQRNCPVLISPTERQTSWDLARATVAIHCSIIFWVGAWNILSPVSKFKGNGQTRIVCNNTASNVEPLLNIPNVWYTFVIYTTVGFFLLYATDTLYGNAGSYGQWYSDRMMASKRLFFVRLPCAMIGTLLLWIGMYDIFDLTIDRNPDSQIYIDFAFIVCGLGMLVGTNTLVWCANIYPDESVFDNDVTPDHTKCQHLAFTIKVVVSILSQNALWLGMYDLLENYYSGGSLGYWREFTWVGVGFVLMSFSGSYMAASWIEFAEEETGGEKDEDGGDDDDEGDSGGGEAETEEQGGGGGGGDGRPAGSWYYTLKMVVAYFGFVMHNTGVWTLLDQYIDNSSFRSVAYIGIGTAGMVLSGSFLPNFAMVWPGDEASGEADTDSASGAVERVDPTAFETLISTPVRSSRSSSPLKRTNSPASYFASDTAYEA